MRYFLSLIAVGAFTITYIAFLHSGPSTSQFYWTQGILAALVAIFTIFSFKKISMLAQCCNKQNSKAPAIKNNKKDKKGKNDEKAENVEHVENQDFLKGANKDENKHNQASISNSKDPNAKEAHKNKF